MIKKNTGRKKQLAKWATGILLSATIMTSSIARENTSKEKKTEIKTGTASWYHDRFQGRTTASGDVFSQKQLTCASNHYPLGTWLKVTNARNGKSVVVRVNDRMSAKMKRVVDLTRMAARTIGIEKSGVGKVMVQNLGTDKPENVL